MKRRDTLVFKLLLTTILGGFLIFGCITLYVQRSMLRHFEILDEQLAVEALNRSLDKIQSEIRNLRTIAGGLAVFDDGEPDYRLSLESLNLDFIASSQNQYNFEAARGLLRTDSGIVEISDTRLYFDEIMKGPFAESRESGWGFIPAKEDGQLYLLSLNQYPSGEALVVIGRKLKPVLNRYTDRTESVDVDFNVGYKGNRPLDSIGVRQTTGNFPVFELVVREDVRFTLEGDGKIHSWIRIDAPYLADGLIIHLSKNPEIKLAGRRQLLILQSVYAGSFVLLLAFLVFWMIRTLSRPVTKLVLGIKTWDGLRLPDMAGLDKRKDEIGLLAQTFINMSSEILTKTRSLEEQAVRDGLTGLFNRRRFDEAFSMEWKRHKRKGGMIALIMADIDWFKYFNDTYGHPAGDRCLRRVAKVLSSNLKRPGDVPFRYGGEEFAVLLADTDAEGALQVAESLRQAVEALKIPNEGSPSGKNLSLSLGLAVCSPKNSSDERGLLLKNADEALYRAKKSGRNQVAVQ